MARAPRDPANSPDGGDPALAASRRQLLLDSFGIMVSAGGFGLVYGLTARQAGFSPIEAGSMSVLVFAGAAQFVAVGYVAGGFSWLAIALLTAFLQARHLLYAAALAPYVQDVPRWQRAAMAHLLTDEAFALAIAHFRRIGRSDVKGYLVGAFVSTFIPWNVATLIGVVLGGSIPDPARLGLDVIFPAAMGGLAVGLVTGRRELAAAISGGVLGVAIGLAWDPAAGIIAGGVIGPAVAMLVPRGTADREREGQFAYGPEPHEHAVPFFPQRAGHVRDDPAHAHDGAGHAHDHPGHAHGHAGHAHGHAGHGHDHPAQRDDGVAADPRPEADR